MTPRRMRWANLGRSQWWIASGAALSVAIFAGAALTLTEPGFPLDDAWIHQTYARNLAERGEWAFVPGVPSAASTSPLYTVLLAVGYLLRFNHFVWAFLLGGATLVGAGWLSGKLARTLYPDLSHASLWTGLAIVTTWQLVWAAVSGMETMLFGLLSLAVVAVAWSAPQWRTETERPSSETGNAQGYGSSGQGSAGERRGASAGRIARKMMGHGVLLGGVGALLTLTRPEGVALVGLAVATVLWAGSSASAGGTPGARMRWAAAVVVSWLIVVAPYLVLNWRVEGTMLPSTSAAKQAEYTSAREAILVARYAKMVLPLLVGGQVLLVPGMLLGGLHVWRRVRAERKNAVLLLPIVWGVLVVSAYAFRLPVAYQHGRYVMPALPHLILMGVGGTLLWLRETRRRRIRRVISRTLALAAIASFPAFVVVGARQYARDVQIINTEMVATARWVRDTLPPQDLLAVHDIGALGYFAPRPILDLAGLVSPEVVPIIRDREALMRLMCERDVRYLMVFPDQRPAPADDPRLGSAPVFETGAPYALAAGGGNMAVYALRWPPQCQ